jgi:hypothetical protein
MRREQQTHERGLLLTTNCDILQHPKILGSEGVISAESQHVSLLHYSTIGLASASHL